MTGLIISVAGLLVLIVFLAIGTAQNRRRASDSHAAAVQRLIDEQDKRPGGSDAAGTD